MKKMLIVLVGLFGISGLFGLDFSTSQSTVEPNKYIEVGNSKYQYIIGTASATGNYYKVGKKIAKYLEEAEVAITDGSLQNFDMLTGEVKGFKINVALIQADVMAYQCSKNPNLCENLMVIETNQNEYVTMVCRADVDIEKKNLLVDVGPMNSGASASLSNIMRLEDDYKFKKVFSPAIDNATISSIENKKLDCFAKTTSSPTSGIIADAINSGLVIKELGSGDLVDTMKINNKKIKFYDEGTIKYTEKNAFFSTKIDTVKTRVLLVVNKERINRKQFNKLLRVINRMTVNGKGLF